MDQEKKEMPEAGLVVVLSGMSGAGKTSAMKALEDLGFSQVEAPLEALRGSLKALWAKGEKNIAIALTPDDFSRLDAQKAKAWMARQGFLGDLMRIALMCPVAEAMRRYAETRRPHPQEKKGMGLEEALLAEKGSLEKAPAGALEIIDTGSLKTQGLAQALEALVGRGGEEIGVEVVSFGFKRGLPLDAQMMFDARFIDNPFYVKELRPLSGRDQAVGEFFKKTGKAERFAETIADFAMQWAKEYKSAQKKPIKLAVGCTGGRHRSVFVAEETARLLKERGLCARALHRDIDLGH